MRSSLFAAAALGPLWLAAAALPASATTISGSTSTPVATATANNGAPDDITIDTGGSINLTTAGPAVTLNSNNAVTNKGTVQINNVSNSTVVQINGGVTGSFTNAGTVQNIEDFTPPDANTDGIYEAPLAQGNNRYTVRLTGAAPFVGSITNSGSIFGEGNDSVGVSIEAPLQGSLVSTGTIGVTGDRSYGVKTTAPVSGDINLGGAVSVSGQGSSAASIGGAVGGSLRIYSTLSANGYSTATRASIDSLLKTIQGTPSEVQQAGSTLIVGGNVAKGVYFGAAPVGTVSTDTTSDKDGDGVVDSAEGTGSLSQFGNAPALVLGGVGTSTNIGAFGTGDNAYGLISRGSISSNGLYDGISATGILVGGLGGTATLAGGIRLVGTLGVTSYEAAATGIRIGAGGVVPELRIENTLGVSELRSTVSAAANTTAIGVLVEAGGRLNTLTNYGTIQVNGQGPTVNSGAVIDKSGTLSTVVNQGAIIATVSPFNASEPTTGKTVALDLSANTTGVTLTQQANPNPIALAGTLDSSNKLTVTATTPTSPSIVGDVLLGNGPNTVRLLGGTMTGALSLGSGSASLTIDNAASYTGALSHTGPALAINVANGALVNTNPATLQASSLSVGGASTISFAVDPANNRSTKYVVSGPATLATGAKIGVNLVSAIGAQQTYTLIQSPQLSIGSIASLTPATPYIAIASLSVDNSIGALNLTLRRRTPAEAGMNQAEGAALDAVLAALPKDPAMLAALDAQTTREGFIGLYDQLLPDYSGGLFRLIDIASRNVSDATAKGGAGNGWIQEITVTNQLKSGHGALPFHGTGFGLAGGLERNSRIGSLGAVAAVFSGDVHNPDLPSDDNANASLIEGGLLWRTQAGGLHLDANGRLGYVHYRSRRQFLVTDSAGATTLSRATAGVATGWTASARFGVAYRIGGDGLFLQPQAHVDYLRLVEGGYTETGGGPGYNLTLDRRIGEEASGSISVRAGGSFGQDFVWRPDLELGYRTIISGSPGVTTARFASGGDPFSMLPASMQKGGAFAQVGVTAGDQYFDLSVAAGAEVKNGYKEGDLRFRVRVLF